MSSEISVVILTRNEADRIADCLKSVDWAEERIVLDDGSTDQTAQIAAALGARVLQRRMDIEGRHRNFGYAQARNEWVLSLDADERVTPALQEEIIRLLQGSPPCNGYSIPRKNFIGPRWIRYGGWYPSPQLRLFRKGCFRYEEAEVHPRAFLDGPSGSLTQDLLHYSYRDLGDFLAKLNRQTTLEANKWVRDGREMSVRRGLWRTVDRFQRSWQFKEGHRDGEWGFIASVFAGFYQFLSFAKYWHAKNAVRPEPFGKLRAALVEGRTVRASTGSARTRSPFDKLRVTGRETLSAVLLTKNEASQIRDCLERLRWVDEIIVVDGESTDETPQICREFGARVIPHRFEGDFGQERNIGNSHATMDWILQLDADDRVTDEFRAAAEEILQKGSPHAAYKFRRTNCFLGHWMRHGGWYHYSLHFFRRGKAVYQGRVHHDLRVEGTIGTLEVPIEHHPFQSLEQFWDRQNRYTTLEAQELLEKQGPWTERELRHQIRVKPAKLFWKMYVKKQGFREGMIGLIFSGLFSFVHFLKWAKLFELTQNKGGP